MLGLHEFCIFFTPPPIFNNIKKASALVYWGIHNLSSYASSQQVDIMKKLSLFNSETLLLKTKEFVPTFESIAEMVFVFIKLGNLS